MENYYNAVSQLYSETHNSPSRIYRKCNLSQYCLLVLCNKADVGVPFPPYFLFRIPEESLSATSLR